MAYRSEKLKHGLTVKEIMVSDTLTLSALARMMSGGYFCKFVIVNERMETVGKFTETELENCIVKYPAQTRLNELPQSVFFV